MGTSTLPSYEPRVIEQFAENLYRKASAFVVGSVVVGAALGAAFGSVPLTSLGSAWPVPSFLGFATLLAGGILGSAVGYVIGDTRSFGYRLQAQSALCQLQTERNTAVLAAAVSARAAQPAQPAPRPAAQPPAAPAPTRAPAPPASQAPAPAPAPAPILPPVAQPAPQPAAAERPATQPPLSTPQSAREQNDASTPTEPPVSAPPVTPPVSAARVA